jgi:ribosome-associated protein
LALEFLQSERLVHPLSELEAEWRSARSRPFRSRVRAPHASIWPLFKTPKDNPLSATRSPQTAKKVAAKKATASKATTTKAKPKPVADKPSEVALAPTSPDPLELALLVVQQLDDDKAENILNIPLSGKSPMADAMIVASGRSARHVSALADHVARKLKEAGASQVRIEGLPNADWVLIDAGDVIVHIFRPEVREFYNLERIWGPDATHTARAPN